MSEIYISYFVGLLSGLAIGLSMCRIFPRLFQHYISIYCKKCGNKIEGNCMEL